MDEVFMNDSLFSKPEPPDSHGARSARVPMKLPRTRRAVGSVLEVLDLSGEAMRDVSPEHEHEHEHEKQPQDAARAIAPVPAVTPGRQAAQEQHYENDQQDQAHEDSFERSTKKKPTRWNTRRYSTTSAYSSTSLPAWPGCSSSSRPTTWFLKSLWGSERETPVNSTPSPSARAVSPSSAASVWSWSTRTWSRGRSPWSPIPGRPRSTAPADHRALLLPRGRAHWPEEGLPGSVRYTTLGLAAERGRLGNAPRVGHAGVHLRSRSPGRQSPRGGRDLRCAGRGHRAPLRAAFRPCLPAGRHQLHGGRGHL